MRPHDMKADGSDVHGASRRPRPEDSSSAAAIGRRVLLVEDESRLRDMLNRAIRDMGFVITAVGSAEAGLRVIDQRQCDIIIIDLNLPGMGGMELFEQLRQRQADVQVIVLTGFGDLETARKAIHMDVVDFLSKPCALGDLEVALERARARCTKLPELREIEDPPEPAPAAAPDAGANTLPAPAPLEEVERQHILAALKRHSGNRAAAAAELGISLRTLYYRLELYQRQGLLQQ